LGALDARRPPARGYVTRRDAQDVLRERIVDADGRPGRAPVTFERVAAEWLVTKARR
jgi:hypothetical protein